MDLSIKPKVYVSPLPSEYEVCLSQDFRLTKIDDIPCAYCGKKMKTQKTIEHIFDTDMEMTTAMLDNAIEMGELLPPFKQQILNFLIQIRIMYGLTTDNQIIKEARVLSRRYIREDILKRYEEIINIIKKASAKRLNTFLMFNEDKCRDFLIRKASYEELIRFVRSKDFLHISPVTKNEDLSKINDVIYDIEEGKEQYTEDYITRKACYKTPKEFFIDLFNGVISSVDHVIPRSKGGTDTRDNFLAVCRDCNEKKKDLSMPIFMLQQSKAKTNIENQLRFLKEKIPKWISQRKLEPLYRDYVENINENLSVMTNGEINLIV